MKLIEFVEGIRKEVIESNLQMYREILKINEKNTDNYSSAINTVFKSLDATGVDALFIILRQVEVDTVSNILGIIDGSSYLNEENAEFVLTISDDNVQLNGDLQDIFLELEESSS